MKKSWKLIPKILSGQKTIETRWYMTRRSPWNTVHIGDTVFFRDTGGPIVAQAQVSDVIQFDHPSQKQVHDIIAKYGGSPGICFVSNPEKTFRWIQNKKYAILIFLENPKTIKPFPVDKTGFGNACAWMTVKNIKSVKLSAKS